MLEVKIVSCKLPLKTAFRIAHGSYQYRENVFLRIKGNVSPEAEAYEAYSSFNKFTELTRYGEAPVVPYYDASAYAVSRDLSENISLETLHGEKKPQFRFSSSASAFNCAVQGLHSGNSHLHYQKRKYKAAGMPKKTSFTIAYNDDIEQMLTAVEKSGFSTIKVKAGIPGDIKRIEEIRKHFPEIGIRVDANQGWSFHQAKKNITILEGLGVELIEEPMAGSPEQIYKLSESCSIPIILDESIQSLEDLKKFSRTASGIVVKIAKVGGPQAAESLIHKAEMEGLRVMLSSMVESSLGIACALPLSPFCDWLDLDAPLLLSQDMFYGFNYVDEVPVGTIADLVVGNTLAEAFDAVEPLLLE
ncbi:MAG: hypothetical protein K9L24_05460 [Spirochaetia bacterium]|nr:hypothetical protein [Spirochaetia bacterium]